MEDTKQLFRKTEALLDSTKNVVKDLSDTKVFLRECEAFGYKSIALFDEVKSFKPKWFHVFYDRKLKEFERKHAEINVVYSVLRKKLGEELQKDELTFTQFLVFINSILAVNAHVNLETNRMIFDHKKLSKHQNIVNLCCFIITIGFVAYINF